MKRIFDFTCAAVFWAVWWALFSRREREEREECKRKREERKRERKEREAKRNAERVARGDRGRDFEREAAYRRDNWSAFDLGWLARREAVRNKHEAARDKSEAARDKSDKSERRRSRIRWTWGVAVGSVGSVLVLGYFLVDWLLR